LRIASVRSALGALLLLVPAVSAAQLPSVQEIFDRYATAVGGRDAWRPVTGRTERGTVDITFAGLTGSYLRYAALPNMARVLLDVSVLQIDNGFDGEKGWESQGGQVTRSSPEDERDYAEPQADGAAFLDPSRYLSAKVVGVESFDSIEAYKVAISTAGGRESTDFFAVESGLRIGTIFGEAGGSRRISYRDYKVIDGKRVPMRVVQDNGQGDLIITIESITFGAPPDSVFRAPPGLR
jgi:hypothetical protein